MIKSSLSVLHVAESASENAATVYLATLAPTGRRSMQCMLKLVLRSLSIPGSVESHDWSSLAYADVVRVRAKLMDQGRAPHSVNLALAAMRGTIECAFHLGQVDAERVLRVKAVKRVPVDSGLRGRSLTKEDVHKLLNCCQRDKSAIGVRDAALLAILVTTGIRRAEASALCIEDYDTEACVLRVRRAKGNRERICSVTKAAQKMIAAWLGVRSMESGPLICRINKSGRRIMQHVSTQTIFSIVQTRAQKAGIGELTPHDLRRTFVTRLLSSTGDINLVRNLVGHADVKTTSRYDLRTHDARHYIEQCKLL